MEARKVERAQTEPITTFEPLPRRGVQLPPLQTNFPAKQPSQRHQRPRPIQPTVDQIAQTTTPVENDALGRKPSRGITMGLFGRNKSYRSARLEAVLAKRAAEGKENTDAAYMAHEKGAIRNDQASLLHDINTISSVPQADSSAVKKRPRRGARTKSFRKASTTWDPPPLFQAYPQAIKHACLPAPSLSADAILRHIVMRQGSGSDHKHNTPEDPWDTDWENQKRHSRNLKKRNRSAYDAIVDSGWTSKIYVLVTSGYFLQYSGEGRFDRLPEKILSLGKDSAAFASDAIHGKQWVLQIAQEVSDYDGSFSTLGSSSMFKKLGFSQEARRAAANFLLVIDCPEEMNAWLVAVRKEIESLGGKKYVPDIALSGAPSDIARKLRHLPSQRYLVRKRQLTEEGRRPLPPEKSTATAAEPIEKISFKSDAKADQKSVHAPSVSNTTASIDQDALDKLRETPRLSYISSAARTVPSSPGSSPAQSPVKGTFFLADSEGPHNGILTEATATSNARRGSSSSPSPPTTACRRSQESDPTQKKTAPRTNSSDGQNPPAAPNFSVPSFSKRYSTVSMVRKSTLPCGRASTTLQATVVEEERHSRESTSNGSSASPRTSPKSSKSLGNLSSHCSSPRPPSFSFVTKSSPGELISTLKSDTTIPHRFSSLGYSRGVSPVPAFNQFPESPHPPPTSALPEIPGGSSTKSKPNSSRHSMQTLLKPSQDERNARRPTSMQVHSPNHVIVDHNTFQIVSKRMHELDLSTTSSATSMVPELTDPKSLITSIPPPARDAPLPPIMGDQEELVSPNQTTMQAPKSLPYTSRPPPPPPTIPPLPRLPSIRVSQRGFRGSFEGPWSNSYSTETTRSQGVRAN